MPTLHLACTVGTWFWHYTLSVPQLWYITILTWFIFKINTIKVIMNRINFILT